MANGQNGREVAVVLWRLLGIAIPVITTVNLAIAGWVLMQVVEIKSNRFTSADGLAVWRELNLKADRANVPPPEVLRRLESIERRLDLMSQKLDER